MAVSARADLLVVNAVVWTDGARRPDVDAIAVSGSRVVGLGRSQALAGLAGPATRRLDACGATVTPGLADAHLHLVQWARSLREVDLVACVSRREAIDRLAAFLAVRPGAAVIVGRGWDANGWSEPPDRQALDAVVADRPVVLHSKDFHAAWLNSAALRACAIGRATTDPEGGRVVRDDAGEPTGVLMEHAVRLCARLEAMDPARDRDLVRAALPRLHAFGVTAVHDFEGPAAHHVLRALTREEPGALRVVMHLAQASLDHALEIGLETGVGDDFFRIGAVKLFADGTLGSRTAALLEPYEGTEDRGFELLGPEELQALVSRAITGGLSVAVHAIGDRAARSALMAFEAAAHYVPRLAMPPRIEHLQLVHPEDLPRLARAGVAASMQPLHCTADAEMAERHWGKRCANAYPWRGLLDAGALLAFGSDAPVESPSVARGLHAATTREREGRTGAFVPGQRLTLDEALAAYTGGPAFLAGAWPRLGSLRPGSAADLVVWNTDLHRARPADLTRARPVTTVLAGRIVFEDGAAGQAPPEGAGRPGVEESLAPGARGGRP